MSSNQSIYQKYNLKTVINTSGRMTILGVSTPREDVVEAVNFGLNHYFEVKDLVNKTGRYIADLLGVEDAVVVSCASAGIAQSVAAVIVKDNLYRLENLHAHPHDVPSEIVVPKGHNVNFGAPVGTWCNWAVVRCARRDMPMNALQHSWLRRLRQIRPLFCISNLITVCRKAC